MANICQNDTTSVDENVETQELSFIAGGNGKWCSNFGSLAVRYKTKPLILPEDSAIATLAIYTKCRTPVDTRICTLMFIAALFMLVKMQPKFPSIGDWISKLYYTDTLGRGHHGKSESEN